MGYSVFFVVVAVVLQSKRCVLKSVSSAGKWLFPGLELDYRCIKNSSQIMICMDQIYMDNARCQLVRLDKLNVSMFAKKCPLPCHSLE